MEPGGASLHVGMFENWPTAYSLGAKALRERNLQSH